MQISCGGYKKNYSTPAPYRGVGTCIQNNASQYICVSRKELKYVVVVDKN